MDTPQGKHTVRPPYAYLSFALYLVPHIASAKWLNLNLQYIN